MTKNKSWEKFELKDLDGLITCEFERVCSKMEGFLIEFGSVIAQRKKKSIKEISSRYEVLISEARKINYPMELINSFRNRYNNLLDVYQPK
jgi:hypothetical protein